MASGDSCVVVDDDDDENNANRLLPVIMCVCLLMKEGFFLQNFNDLPDPNRRRIELLFEFDVDNADVGGDVDDPNANEMILYVFSNFLKNRINIVHDTIEFDLDRFYRHQ